MKVIITGTTGYVGEGVMLACLDNPEIEKVLSISSVGLKEEQYVGSRQEEHRRRFGCNAVQGTDNASML